MNAMVEVQMQRSAARGDIRVDRVVDRPMLGLRTRRSTVLGAVLAMALGFPTISFARSPTRSDVATPELQVHRHQVDAPGRPAAEPQPAKCQVVAIHASKAAPNGARVPANLSAFRRELEDDQFAAYKSFHLLERKAATAHRERASQLDFASGYRMSLQLVDVENSRLKVHIRLARAAGGTSLVDLDYWMRSGGLLLMVGGAYADGKVIFATQCGG